MDGVNIYLGVGRWVWETDTDPRGKPHREREWVTDLHSALVRARGFLEARINVQSNDAGL